MYRLSATAFVALPLILSGLVPFVLVPTDLCACASEGRPNGEQDGILSYLAANTSAVGLYIICKTNQSEIGCL